MAGSMRGLENDQINELWDTLQLGDLLNDLQKENDALMKARRIKDPFYKRNKVVESPAYNVLMERYHTRPPQPKMMTKRTLDRLADPMKGRYESPPKEKKKKSQKMKMRMEKIENETKLEQHQQQAHHHIPVRYHSPIRRDSPPPDENSCEEDSPIRRIRKDSDSFFLTGTMHGEIEMKSQQFGNTQSYHPVMDVRINVDGSQHQQYEQRRPPLDDEIYTSRTKEYLQDALLRSQTGYQDRERKTIQSRPSKKMKSNLDHNFVKEMNSKKSKTKLKSDLSSKKDKITSKKGRGGGGGVGEAVAAKFKSAAGSRRESGVSQLNHQHQQHQQQQPKKESNSTRWASSRDPQPVTKPVSRRLLAPVAGIQSKKSTKKTKKLTPSVDNLVGLERVDENYSKDQTLLRTSSSSAAIRRTQPTRIPSKGSSLLGSRSAPTLKRRTELESEGVDKLAQLEENPPAYRVHAPMPSRLLAKGPSRKPPLAPVGEKSGMTGLPSGAAVRLAPLETNSRVTSESSHSMLPSFNSSSENSKGLIRRTSTSSTDTGPSFPSTSTSTSSVPAVSSSALSISRNASKSRVSMDPSSSDDQIAALFAQHAKKLSENLEKASNLSLKYRHMKDFDGLTASSRQIDSGSLLPLLRSSNQSNSLQHPEKEEGSGGGGRKDEYLPPERLSMII